MPHCLSFYEYDGFSATTAIEVLGVTLGAGPRKKSQAEV